MGQVLYIGAVGRSGSTLLERLLGLSGRLAPLGELVHLWERGLRRNESCSCGRPFRECEFWEAVGVAAFGGWSRLSPDGVIELQRQVDRTRYLPWLADPSRAPDRFSSAHRRFVDDLIDPLYSGISQVLGPDVIPVDASKHPSYAYLLRRAPAVDLRVVHLVRDSRGVTSSWSKQVTRPEADPDGPEPEMERLGTLQAAGRWTSHNLAFDALARMGVPTSLLRYELLTQDPIGSMVDATAVLDRPLVADDFPSPVDGAFDLGVDHTVAGNPILFDVGPILVRSDHGWKDQLPALDSAVVGVLTGVLRRHYERSGG